MSIDWGATLLDPLYASLGVPANLAVPTLTAIVPVTAIDQTQGIEISQGKLGLQTIKPVCSLRMRELAANGLVPANLVTGTISLRPGTPDQADWRIESHQPKPNPSGETAGEVQLILVKA
ncbi:hypothetical protein JQ594_15545 [Bradyrhizobium manausense]|uniref:hypothetical protein n=1 Tax=Bradyrhizobium manausense TaxID=989370 RepID=UPI001BA88999|nr:hypothetical protein [Bradyrhizobium manausense]MBR0687345.1 hypothetical protein [Bradyrhizobium manausense]